MIQIRLDGNFLCGHVSGMFCRNEVSDERIG